MENFPVNVNTAGVCQLAKITVPGGEIRVRKLKINILLPASVQKDPVLFVLLGIEHVVTLLNKSQ